MNKLLNKYRSLSVEVKAALWFVVCNFVNKAISMIVVPIYTRLLSTSEYGTYTVFQSWLNIFIIVMTLEISRGHFALGITKYEDDSDRYTSAMLGLSNATTILFLIVYLFATPFFNSVLEMNTPLVMGMFAYLLFYPAWEFWCIKQRFAYKYKRMVFGTLIVAFLSPIIGVVGIVWLGFKSEAAILSKLVVQGVAALGVYTLFIKKSPTPFVKSYWKEVLPFSLTLLPYLLSTMILNQADRLMINRMVGGSEAAIYSVAYSVAMLTQLLNTAMNNAFVPWMYRRLKGKQYEKIEPVADGLQMLVGIINLILIVFAPEVIAIFAPPQYMEAISIIPPVTASVYFMFIFQRYINVEMYYEKTASISIMSILVALLNIILNYFCILKWGYLAAGYTTLISYILFCIGHYFIVTRIEKTKCEGNIIFHAKGTIITGIGFLIISFGIMWLYDYAVIRYLVAAGLAVVAYKKKDVFMWMLKNKKQDAV